MIYDVAHKTTVTYEGIVRLAEFNLRMRLAEWPDQTILSQSVTLTPPAITSEREGPYLAPVTRARIETSVGELEIDNNFRVMVDREAPQPHPDDPTVAQIRAAGLAAQRLDAMAPANYIYPSTRVPLPADIGAWCAKELANDRGIVEAGLALAKKIKAEFRYDPDATDADTPVLEAFAARHGVCQDFAHIMLSGLRSAGLPAAYVSGFLRTEPPPGKPKLMGADATHAWVMIWCGESLGWLGFDPTNGCTVGPDHIISGIGRDYADVSPVDGILLGLAEQTLEVAVDVIPVAGS